MRTLANAPEERVCEIPVASLDEIRGGWERIELVERAVRASGDLPSVRQQTLRAELVAAGIAPESVDSLIREDSIEQAHVRLARSLVAGCSS